MNTTERDIIPASVRDGMLNRLVSGTGGSTRNDHPGVTMKELLLHCLEVDKHVAELQEMLNKEFEINNYLARSLESDRKRGRWFSRRSWLKAVRSPKG
jgi:hypothetical protein